MEKEKPQMTEEQRKEALEQASKDLFKDENDEK